MNSKDYRNIREAYLQVYAPQELTEEQVWEGVETWVNDLIEEGYDLSDYTWEEMYESYLSETPTPTNNALGNVFGGITKSIGDDISNRFSRRAGGEKQRAQNKSINATNQRAQLGVVKTDKGFVAKSSGVKDGETSDQWLQRSSDAVTLKNRLNRETGLGKPKPTAPQRPAATPTAPVTQRPAATPTAPQRPAATPTPAAPRPAATPTQRPTATPSASGPKATPTTPTTPTKPAIGTTPGGTKFERRTPTSAELSAAQDARSAGKGEEGAIKAGVEASKPETPAPNPVKADVPGFALGGKPKEPKKTPITSGFDMFDVVKGYLIGEGYADTEEAALAIMANMSEEWKYSIMETVISTTGQVNPPIKPGPILPKAPNMGANRPYEDPFINPSGSRAPKGASNPVKKDTKTA